MKEPADIDDFYRKEGWGRLAEAALGIRPQDVESQARIVARAWYDSLRTLMPNGFVWIDKPVKVRGDDFVYEAVCLCSFPKSSGKVRYIVEDRGRLFIQRLEQITFIDTPADTAAVGADWRDDPSADERWNAGLDYGQTQLCNVLGVDPASVSWDAATETLDGDVRSVIGNILRVRFGDDWSSPATQAPISVEPKRWLVEETLPSGSILWQCFEHKLQAETSNVNGVITPLYAHQAQEPQPSEAPTKDETGWLIELKGNTPTWFQFEYDDDWTPDASKAVRFARKEDAEKVIDYFGWTEAFASATYGAAILKK